MIAQSEALNLLDEVHSLCSLKHLFIWSWQKSPVDSEHDAVPHLHDSKLLVDPSLTRHSVAHAAGGIGCVSVGHVVAEYAQLAAPAVL